MIKYMVIEVWKADPEFHINPPLTDILRYGITDIQDAEDKRYSYLVANPDVLPNNVSVVQYQA